MSTTTVTIVVDSSTGAATMTEAADFSAQPSASVSADDGPPPTLQPGADLSATAASDGPPPPPEQSALAGDAGGLGAATGASDGPPPVELPSGDAVDSAPEPAALEDLD